MIITSKSETFHFLHPLEGKNTSFQEKIDSVEKAIQQMEKVESDLISQKEKIHAKLDKIPQIVLWIVHHLFFDLFGIKAAEKSLKDATDQQLQISELYLPTLQKAKDHFTQSRDHFHARCLTGLATGLLGQAFGGPLVSLAGMGALELAFRTYYPSSHSLPDSILAPLRESSSNPQEALLTFLSGIESFKNNPQLAEKIQIPEGTTITVEGDRCFIRLPENAPIHFFCDPSTPLSEKQFNRFNKMAELGALEEIGKLPKATRSLPKTLNISGLKTFRSIPTVALKHFLNNHLMLGREIALERTPKGIKFLKGGLSTNKYTISQIDFLSGSSNLNEKEGGVCTIHLKWGIAHFSEKIFVSDISDFFTIALKPVT